MRHESLSAAHWCNVHLMHDRYIWIYLAIALTLILLTILLITAGGGTVLDRELQYYATRTSPF